MTITLLDSSVVMSVREVLKVVADLHARAFRSDNSHQNLAIFRLACGCGLRRSEIAGLNIGDVTVVGEYPYITIRKEIAKGREGKRRARQVPLSWDAGTLGDIASWRTFRLGEMSA